MAVSERDRRVLHQSLVERTGEQEADVLMELLPPVGWADVATKSDLHALKFELQAAFHRDLIRQTWIFVGTVVAATGAIAGILGAS